jgi:hypothetical protein
MGLTITKVSGGGQIPIFQKVLELAQGGFTLTTTGLVAGATIKKGTPVLYSESARTAIVCKRAVMQATATDSATDYKVLKGHHFAVGEIITTGTNAAKYAITTITTTNADYDTIAVGTTLGVELTAGDVIFQSSGTAGANGGALLSTPNGLLYEDAVVGVNEPISALIRGSVYKRRIANGVHSLDVAALKLIVFSESY